MTGTPFCMLPVTSLNGLKIGEGKVGNIFNKLINLWGKNTDTDIVNQIKHWNSFDTNNINTTTPYSFKK